MKKTNQQFIAFSCALLLQLGLFTSLSHEVQHPFHAHDELCASFINFEQHKLVVDTASILTNFNLYAIEVLPQSLPTVITAFRRVYSSRAPPLS